MKLLSKLLPILIILIFSSQLFAAPLKKNKPTGKDITITSEGFSYQITSVPSFVSKFIQPDTLQGQDYGDIVFKLIDRQVSLAEQMPQEYTHFKSEALSASALSDISKVYITFNPAYQKLYLHGIHVLRNGKPIDLTHSVKLDLIRRESNLENNMYQGEVTAIGVLPDIRIHDVIDLEYTVAGLNPIFGKHYAAIFSVTQSTPVEHFRLIVTTPENRPLKIQPPAGAPLKQENAGNTVHYSVEKENIKAMQPEDNTPGWFQAGETIQVSEYQDWKQVADWAADLFKVENDFSPEIQQQLQAWKDLKLSKEQLTVEVLRWVQTEIRYFGIELGENSHLPAPPNVVVSRKFGDCKDKSLLLVSLLKALDIDAEPALASMTFLRNVEKMMPSHAVFDHAIVRVTFDGKSYWLDPTFAAQYGALSKLGITDFGSVLPLGLRDEGKLETATYPLNYEGSYVATDSYKLAKFNEPVQLTSRIKINYRTAEYIRFAYEKQSKDEFNKGFQEDIKRIYPQAKPVGEPEFIDDRVNNEITFIAKYTIDDFFKYEPGRLTAGFLGTEILGIASLPNVTQRHTPFSLPLKTKIIQIEEFEFPADLSLKPVKNNDTKTGEFWTFTSNTALSPQKMSQIWTLKANKESVPSQKMEAYIAETKALREQMGFSFKLPVGIVTDADKQKAGAEYQQFDRYYGSSASSRVGVAKKDIINYWLTTRDIESGKLFGKNLAEALKIRSQIYDSRGDVKKALTDIRAAELLVPDSLDYKLSEADTLLGDGQFVEANLLYEKVIASELASNQQRFDAHRAYGKSLYYLGNKERSIENLSQSYNAENSLDSIYLALWQFIVSDQNDISKTELNQRMDGLQDHAWPYPVGEMFLGKLSPDALIAAAASADKGLQQDQLCEAYFYLGKKYVKDQNKEKAKEYFQMSVAQGVGEYLENNFSLLELGKKKAPFNAGWKK